MPNLFPIGISKATSTSKSKNKIATSQNLGQNGTTLGPAGSNPHSKGAAALLGRDENIIVTIGTININKYPSPIIVNIVVSVLAVLECCFQNNEVPNKTAAIDSAAIVEGSKDFHAVYISWSYRSRGNTARGNRSRIATTAPRSPTTQYEQPNHIMTDNIPRNMSAAYSPRKIRTNIIPLYSVLNPDTSSLSPSTKSKGVRILSARQHNIKIEMTPTIQVRSMLRERVNLRKTIYNKKRNLYTISYDTV